MRREYVRRIIVFEDHFKIFRKTLDKESLKKVYYVLNYLMIVDVVPAKFLKSIVGKPGLYEIRVDHAGNTYRIFCCFDEGDLVILFNGFQKKTQKLPKEQLEKAELLMRKYYRMKYDENPNEK